MKIIEPEYYKEFECIGNKCSSTCCKGWNIWIDKESYDTYKNQNDEFSMRLKKSIRKKADNEDDDDYGEFVLDHNSKCKMLNKSNLCELFINKGEEYLCKTCTVFPRTGNNYIEDIYEKNLEASCPVVSKYLVDKIDGIRFIQEEKELDSLDERIITEWYDGDIEKDKLTFDIRNEFISICQVADSSLKEKLLIIKELQDKLQKYIDEDDLKSCRVELESYKNSISLKIYDNNIIKRNESILDIINHIFEEPFYIDERLDDYIEILTKYIKEIRNKTYKETQKNENEFNEWFKGKEYILENYLVYDIFKNYMNSILEYDGERVINLSIISNCILKSFFRAYYNINKKLADNIIVDIITLYEKYMQEEFVREKINEYLEDNGLKSIEKLSILL